MKTTTSHNSNRLSCTPGARRFAGLLGGVRGGLSPDLTPTFGFLGYLSAGDPMGDKFTRDTAFGRGSKSSPLANEHRPGSTGWQVRLIPGRRMPIIG